MSQNSGHFHKPTLGEYDLGRVAASRQQCELDTSRGREAVDGDLRTLGGA